MDKTILAFIEKLEVYKTKIKALHWDADSLSQHKLCDEIAESIAEFQDQVSEVEQSISGKLGKNMFRPDNQEFGEIGTLKEFVKSVIDHTNTFYKELQNKGDEYIGMRSDCESFLSDMQRKLYLVNFTMKEDMKRRIAEMVNESRPKNLANVDDIDKFIGRRPTTMKARINQIYRIVKKYGIDSRLYSDGHWQAIEDYYRAITSLGYDVELKPCADVRHADSLESDGGYTDYDENDHMPRSKQYYIKITSDDGMAIDGYIKCMAAGTVEDPFSRYDTCMVLWPKNNRNLGENKEMKQQMVVTEGELKEIIKEAAMKVLSETPLNYDIDNFSGRWNKNTPDEELNPDDYLDNPYDAPNSWDDDEWVDGDKDMENEYSWNAFDRQAIAPGVETHYNVMKTGVPGEIDKAISWRNKDNDWSEMELRNRDRMMGKWVNGERTADQIGDSWEDIHYEGKEPRKTIKESGDTKRGAYLKGRPLGRRLANNDASTLKDYEDIGNPYVQAGMKDQYYYETEKDPTVKDKKKQDMQDRYNRLRHDDKFFDDWQKHIDKNKSVKMTESELKQVVRQAAIRVINEMSTAEREKRLEKQMSWREFENDADDMGKLSDLIDKGKEYQEHTKDTHKENPDEWKKITSRRK